MEHKHRERRWNEPKRNDKPSRISMPEHAHPVARFIFDQMRAQGVTYMEMEYCSGVLRCTTKAWRTDNAPGLDTADACLGVLGFSLIPVPNPEHLSPELRADLEALADKHGVDGDLSTELIAACVGRYPWTQRSWSAARNRRVQPVEDLAA